MVEMFDKEVLLTPCLLIVSLLNSDSNFSLSLPAQAMKYNESAKNGKLMALEWGVRLVARSAEVKT